jgi:hypothetical protein
VEVPCSERVAICTDPESCGIRREATAEALTGEPAGWVLSHEMTFRMPTMFCPRKATWSMASTRAVFRSGAVEDPSMSGRSLYGNREVSWLADGPWQNCLNHDRRPASGRQEP